ncbi:MAG: hypothetical protein QM783_10045 [Phycisphaerales bacterium]
MTTLAGAVATLTALGVPLAAKAAMPRTVGGAGGYDEGFAGVAPA